MIESIFSNIFYSIIKIEMTIKTTARKYHFANFIKLLWYA